MRINVLGKLPQDFFKGLASKNAEIYIDCLDIISTMNGSLSFKEKYEDSEHEPLMTKTGREWLLDAIALQWKHVF